LIEEEESSVQGEVLFESPEPDQVSAMVMVKQMIQAVNPELGAFLSAPPQTPSASESQPDEPTPNEPPATLEKLRSWYRAAVALEKPYLAMIAEAGKALKAGNLPEANIVGMMHSDLAEYAQREDVVVRSARKVLIQRGRSIGQNQRLYKGNVYVLKGDPDNFTVDADQRGTILSVIVGRVETSKLMPIDTERFANMEQRIVQEASSNRSKSSGIEH
jgi:hypothetical protein